MATILPFIYYFALRGRLTVRAGLYSERIPAPRVVQGELTNLQTEEGGSVVSYLFPAQDLDGTPSYLGGQMLVKEGHYTEMAMGDPLTIVHSGPRPRVSFIREEVLAPPVRVYLAFAVWLVLASVNGLVLAHRGWRGGRNRFSKRPHPSARCAQKTSRRPFGRCAFGPSGGRRLLDGPPCWRLRRP